MATVQQIFPGFCAQYFRLWPGAARGEPSPNLRDRWYCGRVSRRRDEWQHFRAVRPANVSLAGCRRGISFGRLILGARAILPYRCACASSHGNRQSARQLQSAHACMADGSMTHQQMLRRAHHCAGRGGASFSVSVKPKTKKRDHNCLEVCIEGMAQKRFRVLAM